MARSLSHEAKQLISSADNGKKHLAFSLKKQSNAVYVGNTSYIKHEWLTATYSDLQRLRQANAASVVCCKICLSFFQVMERNNPYQKQMTEKIPCSSTYKTKIRFTQKYEVQYTSFLKPWSKTAHFKRGRLDIYCVLPAIQTKRRLTQKNWMQLT